MPKKNQTGDEKSAKAPVSAVQITVFALAIAVAFVAGTRSDYIMATLTGQAQVGTIDMSSIQGVYKTLAAEYNGELNEADLIDGAKKGMIEAVGDPYTVYFTAEEAEEFLGDLEGTFEGIGAELGKENGSLIIVNPLDGSPAEKAGVKAKDVIVSVNDEDAVDWSIEQAVATIRGEKGTTVRLGVVRDGEPKEISVVRGTINLPSVETEIKDGNIGIIRISRFSQTETTSLVRKAAEDFERQNVDSIVLDLRGNGGGYLQAAVDIASLWLDDKVVVTERHHGKISDTIRTSGASPFKGIKTVVLVDGSSASASEILAGALRDNGAATLVGTQTFGKGVVQDIKELSDGGTLKVTVASWYTPNGNNIADEGLKPDKTVKLTEEDIEAERDRQLIEALKLLN